jgi:hypothetical protein
MHIYRWGSRAWLWHTLCNSTDVQARSAKQHGCLSVMCQEEGVASSHLGLKVRGSLLRVCVLLPS